MKTVRAPNGAWVEIDTSRTWHGFKRGDVITCLRENSQWFGKRAILEGTYVEDPTIIYATIPGRDFLYYTNDPNGIVLLERPGLQFKAGYRVSVWKGIYNWQGSIVSIEPETEKYLVEFDEPLPGQFRDRLPEPRYLTGNRLAYVYGENSLSPIGTTFVEGERGMAENVIIDANRIPHPVDANKSLFDFKAGDIIICDEGELKDKRIRVRGVEIGDFLFGEVIGERRILWTNHPEGLILLERPGFPFKVGDRVRAIGGSPKGQIGTVIILCPNQTNFIFNILVEFENWTGGNNGLSSMLSPECFWFPKRYRNLSCHAVRNKFWCSVKHLTMIDESPSATAEEFIREQFPEEQTEQAAQDETQPYPVENLLEALQDVRGEPPAPAAEAPAFLAPAWFEELSINVQAKRAHFFIIHGNIYDWQRNSRAKRVTLRQYFSEVYRDRMVIFYSLSEGISFGSADDEKWFRNRLTPAQDEETAGSAREKLKQKVQVSRAGGAGLGDLVGRAPDAVLPMLERLLAAPDSEAPKKRVLVIESAHNIAPRQITPAERATVETLERWARDERFQTAGSLVILTTPFKGQIAESLSSSFSGTRTIRVPKPDEVGRISYWQEAITASGLQLAEGLTPESLGRLTGGLSLRQIDDLCALAKVKSGKIEQDFVKDEKRRVLDDEFGDRVKIKVPKFGFEFFGGKENVRAHLLQIRDDILRGMLRRAPMGILASGPPGTGKTFLFECWANECGFNFVEIENVRSKWVGESEEIMERILAALDDLSPVIVVEDEADQSEPSRDAPSGDSGVSSRLRQMKFKFCSEPKRRGRVVWVRISNRDDLLDAAYKRKGRTDDNIPFVLPSEVEYAKIFEVMFKRYAIATTITDFAPLAKSVAQRIYCTGADVEWMVLQADKLAGAAGKESIELEHVQQAIDDWEMDLDPNDIDNQIILAIKGSDKRLRPENWQEVLAAAEKRIEERAKAMLPQLATVNGNGAPSSE
ncbi:ATP-binding protein [Candidatus Falkowbacteria bacterium]|nr:ATP-binding protein [Candidatus Falkowbacteria bacterium]